MKLDIFKNVKNKRNFILYGVFFSITTLIWVFNKESIPKWLDYTFALIIVLGGWFRPKKFR